MESDPEQPRQGPHPLALHVASGTNSWASAAAAYPLFHRGQMTIHPTLVKHAAALRHDAEALDPRRMLTAVMTKAQTRLTATFEGITSYQQHPYRRQTPDRPLFHKVGTAELRDYSHLAGAAPLPGDAPILLAVPSLVNPAYILDLQEDHSFLRYLRHQGIRPYLLDWTSPGADEMRFGLEDYITRRLVPLIRHLHRHHGRKIHLLGYCMGGNLSLAAAQVLQADDILESLTLIATPWDFHADQPIPIAAVTDRLLALDSLVQAQDAVPAELLHLFFFSLDPTLSDRKFRKFSRLTGGDNSAAQDGADESRTRAQLFVAIEDWANDGAPLAPGVAKDCLLDWYRANLPHKKAWRIADQVIDPTALTLPGQIITPRRDRIVPPASAKALRAQLPHFHHIDAAGGHVNMIAGQGAKTSLWPKIALKLK